MVTVEQLQAEIRNLHQEIADLKQANTELQTLVEVKHQTQQVTETALQSSEAELRALFAAMQDIVIVKDFNGRYLKIAPTQLDNLYKVPDELIGKTEHEVFPKETADRFVGYIQQVLTTRQPMTVEFCLPIRGVDTWFSTNIAPLSEDSIIWVARDISGRMQVEADLLQANQQITLLNDRLKAENMRMSAELEVTHRLQQMVLPIESELQQITELDIAGFMESAAEVGGDYYDVMQHNGKIQIGIGDVTGHGLESGVLMLMAQTAVRSLLANGETDLVKLINTVNQIIYSNTRRMKSHKNMSLALLEYEAGLLRLSGQHEELIIVHQNGQLEEIDTLDLGFPIGLEADITSFVAETTIKLQPGDVAVLYTDGITEAINNHKHQYGLNQMFEILQQNRHHSANQIRNAVIDDLKHHIGDQKVFDDITLLVIKYP